MKKKRQGFTLIELLAVIVILGLLLAIAIPSVTKYITQSRKKTITTTIGNYIGALTNQVNDIEYVFTESNTVYAVPIECISLERGGTDPFGEWMQASNSYWAYVLVQYDDSTSSYTYGFTFKDSAGYGLYPTSTEKLNENGSQIQTGLDLTKPKTGTIEKITSVSNWTGFDVDFSTSLIVLEAEAEDISGDGKTTCTLCQKGDNYTQVEEEKANIKDRTLIEYNVDAVFWKYRDNIKTITFEDNINIPNNAYMSWDVSESGNGKVMAYIKRSSTNYRYYDLFIQGDGKIYANPNSSNLFYRFDYLDVINNIGLLDTSNVTNMRSMFSDAGYHSKVFTLDLGNNFDTSKVTNMHGMFFCTGHSSTSFTLDLGDKFDTSNVVDMQYMFYGTGQKSPIFTLDLGEKFNTRKVTNMKDMFGATGTESTVFTLDLGDKFDTRNVVDMQYMFYYTGAKSTEFTLDLGDNFNTSKVSNMQDMFYGMGEKSLKLTLDLGDKFDTSNVSNMARMFRETGESSPVFTLDLGDNFDTSNVTSMYRMFDSMGYSNPNFTLDLGNKFNTSNVTDMYKMFYYSGYKSSLFKIDCSNWDVKKVTRYTDFNTGVTTKVNPPIWK